MSVSMVAAVCAVVLLEVVVIRDGPLFIRPLFLLSQRGFHPSSVPPQGEGEGAERRRNGPLVSRQSLQ